MSEAKITLRCQELGEELRVLRESAGMNAAEAAKRIDVSPSKLSRIEHGWRNPPVEDVAALLAVYEVKGEKRRELLALAREAVQRGWWQRDRPDFGERQRTLISLESKADNIVNFEGMLVPGLLQTGEYTRAVLTEGMTLAEDEIEQSMVVRLRRHSVLLRQRPPDVLAIIDELALRRVVGGVNVLRRQMEHLVEAAVRPNIRIRIVPNSVRAHPGVTGSFAILTQAAGPSAVFLENMTSSLFLEEQAEVGTYRQAVRNLLSLALDETQSVEFIASLATRLETEASSAWSPST